MTPEELAEFSRESQAFQTLAKQETAKVILAGRVNLVLSGIFIAYVLFTDRAMYSTLLTIYAVYTLALAAWLLRSKHKVNTAYDRLVARYP